jgi:hypothetical protein
MQTLALTEIDHRLYRHQTMRCRFQLVVCLCVFHWDVNRYHASRYRCIMMGMSLDLYNVVLYPRPAKLPSRDIESSEISAVYPSANVLGIPQLSGA